MSSFPWVRKFPLGVCWSWILRWRVEALATVDKRADWVSLRKGNALEL